MKQMRYFAKVNFAYPGVGLIRSGDVLSEKQTAALGKENLRELLRRDVLEPEWRGCAPAMEQMPDEEADAAVEAADAELLELAEADDEPEMAEADVLEDIVEAEAPKRTGRKNK